LSLARWDAFPSGVSSSFYFGVVGEGFYSGKKKLKIRKKFWNFGKHWKILGTTPKNLKNQIKSLISRFHWGLFKSVPGVPLLTRNTSGTGICPSVPPRKKPYKNQDTTTGGEIIAMVRKIMGCNWDLGSNWRSLAPGWVNQHPPVHQLWMRLFWSFWDGPKPLNPSDLDFKFCFFFLPYVPSNFQNSRLYFAQSLFPTYLPSNHSPSLASC